MQIKLVHYRNDIFRFGNMLGGLNSASVPAGLNDMFGTFDTLSMDEPIRRRSKSQQRPAKEQLVNLGIRSH
jgi:hypothetical protein